MARNGITATIKNRPYKQKMIEIKPAKPDQFLVIQNLAHKIWPNTFKEILSQHQIDYMLELMYSLPNLQKQYKNGHRFLLLTLDSNPVGFASYESNFKSLGKTKIHKIYVMPELQGKGLGKKMLDYITQLAKNNGDRTLTLNVNRFNKALKFYERIGFTKITSEDIDIGNGFLMEDFVLDKSI